MGYNTDFYGVVTVEPALNAQEIEYLNKFSRTRRMNRAAGPYFVDGTGDFGQGNDADIRNYNQPPEGQPGLWCQWVPSEDGTQIEWDGGEKFYEGFEWMKYIVEQFLQTEPVAKQKEPERFAFLQGHVCNGEIEAHGDEYDDIWMIRVKDNKVTRLNGRIEFDEEEER